MFNLILWRLIQVASPSSQIISVQNENIWANTHKLSNFPHNVNQESGVWQTQDGQGVGAQICFYLGGTYTLDKIYINNDLTKYIDKLRIYLNSDYQHNFNSINKGSSESKSVSDTVTKYVKLKINEIGDSYTDFSVTQVWFKGTPYTMPQGQSLYKDGGDDIVLIKQVGASTKSIEYEQYFDDCIILDQLNTNSIVWNIINQDSGTTDWSSISITIKSETKFTLDFSSFTFQSGVQSYNNKVKIGYTFTDSEGNAHSFYSKQFRLTIQQQECELANANCLSLSKTSYPGIGLYLKSQDSFSYANGVDCSSSIYYSSDLSLSFDSSVSSLITFNEYDRSDAEFKATIQSSVSVGTYTISYTVSHTGFSTTKECSFSLTIKSQNCIDLTQYSCKSAPDFHIGGYQIVYLKLTDIFEPLPSCSWITETNLAVSIDDSRFLYASLDDPTTLQTYVATGTGVDISSITANMVLSLESNPSMKKQCPFTVTQDYNCKASEFTCKSNPEVYYAKDSTFAMSASEIFQPSNSNCKFERYRISFNNGDTDKIGQVLNQGKSGFNGIDIYQDCYTYKSTSWASGDYQVTATFWRGDSLTCDLKFVRNEGQTQKQCASCNANQLSCKYIADRSVEINQEFNTSVSDLVKFWQQYDNGCHLTGNSFNIVPDGGLLLVSQTWDLFTMKGTAVTSLQSFSMQIGFDNGQSMTTPCTFGLTVYSCDGDQLQCKTGTTLDISANVNSNFEIDLASVFDIAGISSQCNTFTSGEFTLDEATKSSIPSSQSWPILASSSEITSDYKLKLSTGSTTLTQSVGSITFTRNSKSISCAFNIEIHTACAVNSYTCKAPIQDLEVEKDTELAIDISRFYDKDPSCSFPTSGYTYSFVDAPLFDPEKLTQDDLSGQMIWKFKAITQGPTVHVKLNYNSVSAPTCNIKILIYSCDFYWQTCKNNVHKVVNSSASITWKVSDFIEITSNSNCANRVYSPISYDFDGRSKGSISDSRSLPRINNEIVFDTEPNSLQNKQAQIILTYGVTKSCDFTFEIQDNAQPNQVVQSIHSKLLSSPPILTDTSDVELSESDKTEFQIPDVLVNGSVNTTYGIQFTKSLQNLRFQHGKFIPMSTEQNFTEVISFYLIDFDTTLVSQEYSIKISWTVPEQIEDQIIQFQGQNYRDIVTQIDENGKAAKENILKKFNINIPEPQHSYPNFPTARIKCDTYGNVTIYFSNNGIKQFSPDVLNSSNIWILLIPHDDEQHPVFGAHKNLKRKHHGKRNLQFTWEVTRVRQWKIVFWLNFSSKFNVSSGIHPDNLIVIFREPILISYDYNVPLSPNSYVQSVQLVKQIPEVTELTGFAESFGEKVSDASTWTVVGAVLLQFAGFTENMPLFLTIRNCQLILYNEMFKFNYPSNVHLITDELAKLTRWDILESFMSWDLILEFTENFFENFRPRNRAVQANGMDSYNALINLNTVAIFMFIMYARIFYSLLVLLLCCCRQSAHNYTLWKGMFLNEILSMGNETYIDLLFVIALYKLVIFRNKVDFTKSGEIVGLVILITCLLVTAIYALSVLYMLTKSQEELEDEEFQEFMGEIQDGFKLDTVLRRNYNFQYILRRTIFFCIGYFQVKVWKQFVISHLLVLFSTIYIAEANIFQKRFYNQFEMFNELIFAFLTYHMILFSRDVDVETQYLHGWQYMGILGLYLVICLFIVLYVMADWIYQSIKESCSDKKPEQNLRTELTELKLQTEEQNVDSVDQKTAEKSSSSSEDSQYLREVTEIAKKQVIDEIIEHQTKTEEFKFQDLKQLILDEQFILKIEDMIGRNKGVLSHINNQPIEPTEQLFQEFRQEVDEYLDEYLKQFPRRFRDGKKQALLKWFDFKLFERFIEFKNNSECDHQLAYVLGVKRIYQLGQKTINQYSLPDKSENVIFNQDFAKKHLKVLLDYFEIDASKQTDVFLLSQRRPPKDFNPFDFI